MAKSKPAVTSSFEYDIEAMRKRMKEQASGKTRDPLEFVPGKNKDPQTPLRYRFYVLPGLQAGERCFKGTANQSMGPAFCIKHGDHWINQKPYPCPRILLEEECEICTEGFDLLKEIDKDDKVKREAIRSLWLSSAYFMVNIYFPHSKSNPEALRGQVRYYNAPKTCADLWYAALCRDEPGDAADPEAFGVFCNPAAAFLFQLEVLPNGRNNGYKTSRFLAQLGAHPIAYKGDDKSDPDFEAIQNILDNRIDLYTKIDQPNLKQIRQLAIAMKGGVVDPDGDPDATPGMGQATQNGELNEEAPAPAKAAAKVPAPVKAPAKPAPKPAAKPAPPPVEEEEPVAEAEVQEEVETPVDEEPVVEAEVQEEVETPVEEEPEPAPPKRVAPKPAAPAAKAPAKQQSIDDDDDGLPPPPKAAAKPAAAATKTVATATAKAPAKAVVKAPAKPAASDDEVDTDVQALLGKLRKNNG